MSVKFGLALGAYSAGVPAAADLIRLAVQAEAAGFDSVQAGDHIQWHAPILEATALMATFAAVTRRIRIASDVIILPLRDPVLMAKTIASLDVLSGGRVIFGIGVGGDHPREYEAMRVPLAERGSRANESLEIITGLFENERFSYTGKHFAIEDVAIAPRPIQRPLPLWVGGMSEAALRRAARYGHGWIAAFSSERKFSRLAGTLRGFLDREGRAPAGFTFGTFIFINADADPARAREAAAAYINRVYRLPGDDVIGRYGAAGSVPACVERTLAYVEAGARYIVLSPVCGYQEWPRQLEAYGEIIAEVTARAGRGEVS